jgi:hypothetical protein
VDFPGQMEKWKIKGQLFYFDEIIRVLKVQVGRAFEKFFGRGTIRQTEKSIRMGTKGHPGTGDQAGLFPRILGIFPWFVNVLLRGSFVYGFDPALKVFNGSAQTRSDFR